MPKREDLIQEANAHYQRGEFKEARALLEQFTSQEPAPSLLNQLGNICNKQADYSAAEEYYQQALRLQPDYLEAMYNFALVLRAQKKTVETIAALMALLEAAPHYYQAHYLLGKLLLEEKAPEEADLHFREIVKLAANNETILQNIVALLLEHNAYQQAEYYCEKLIKINPNNKEILYNLAVIAARKGDIEKAKNDYQFILTKDPEHFASLNNLAVIYLEQQQIDLARLHFQKALQLSPGNESIKYTLEAISGEGVAKEAPASYIKNLFDHYAQHYEIHLRQGLDYQVPELIKAALQKAGNIISTPSWRILDLGCGTGLMGDVLKDWANELIGVDLSEKMLEQAERKGIYQRLIPDDMQAYLENHQENFDLIIAADVLIYLGDLSLLFAQIANHLNPKAYFSFSIEVIREQNYAMQPSGRFCHSEKYIRTLAEKNHMKILYFQSANTRQQRNQDVPGAIIVLQKQ